MRIPLAQLANLLTCTKSSRLRPAKSIIKIYIEMEDIIGVVLDVGSKTTKAGFAGESFPRTVIPTAVGRFRRPGLVDGLPLVYCGDEAVRKRGVSSLVWPVQGGLVQDWDELEKLWHHIFYKELHVPPESTRILHAVHPLLRRSDKERMAEILFESFAITGLYLAKSPTLVLHASGRTSGVVWEIGSSCSYAAPVFEGFPLKFATITSPITGEVMTNRLQKLMAQTGYSFTTPAEIDLLDQIKANLCYVSQDYDKELSETAGYGECKVKYDLPDGQHILLGEERFQVPEVLFRPYLENRQCKNLVEAIRASIDLCDIDYRSMFYNNIIVSGGSTLFPGFIRRLETELSQYKRSLPNVKINIDAMPMRQYAAWAGGSVVASMKNLNGFWLTKEEYEDSGPDRVQYKFF